MGRRSACLADGRLTVAAHAEGAGGPIRIGVGEDVRELRPGDSHSFALAAASTHR